MITNGSSGTAIAIYRNSTKFLVLGETNKYEIILSNNKINSENQEQLIPY
jgi:hypothetical protein